MQISYLYTSNFPFKNIAKNVWVKSNDAYLLPIRVHTMINHIFDLFFTTISMSKIFSERELKNALHDTLTQAAWYGLLSTMAN